MAGRRVIRLDEFLDLPRHGWQGRNRAIARQLLEVVGLAAFFIGMLAITFAAIWLLAPR